MQTMELTGRTQSRFGLSATPEKNRVSRCFVMEDPFGFHATPAALLAKTALQHDSEITVSKRDGYPVNAKSIMGLLTLQMFCGDEFTVTAEGDDAAEAIAEIEHLFAGTLSERHLYAIPVVIVAAARAPDASQPQTVPVWAKG